ncbi:MAG: DNA gyrase subunit B [Planctomycetia bacterium]|nr:MAG: DNA gyrase subunit B [Planctomycetia bacterium]
MSSEVIIEEQDRTNRPGVQPAYDADSVQVLEGPEHIRARPGMYIGDTNAYGLHHILYEVLDNSVDEALAGHCHNIRITLRADGAARVEDDGRGIPVGWKAEHGMSALELIMTKTGAGAKFDRDSYKVSAGLHGIGVTATNACSEWLEARSIREGKVWAIRFERGRTVSPLEAVEDAPGRTGTIVTFKPDPKLFSVTEFSHETIARRVREMAYLNSGVRIVLCDERNGQTDEYFYEDGIRQFVQHLNEGKQAYHDVIHFTREDADARLACEVALQWTDSYVENSLSFANNVNTKEGGTHLSGFRAALTRVVNNYAKKANLYKANDPPPQGEDIREGLTAVISVKVPEPQFESQTKIKLNNSEVGTFVEAVVGELLTNFLEEHPPEAKRIVQKAVQAAAAREAARKARETARKSALAGGGLSRKLVDCSSRDVESTELFIVEGDSAAGSAKGHRDTRTQAVLPIRGKILNVEKARLHKVLSHEEILEIIKALGTGIDQDFDVSKLRYGRIILMTDADVDGSHIRTLLLTFFFRQMRALIDNGRIFIAQPPLYQLARGKRVEYVLDDAALNSRLSALGLEHTRLEIRRPGAAVREVSGALLADLLRVLEDIDRQARVMGRRGVDFARYVRRFAPEGRYPAIRATRGADEHFFHTDADFAAFSGAGADGVARQDLPEVRRLADAFERLTVFGCGPLDLFLKREERVTGDLSEAVFVLRNGDEEPVELENLGAVASGVRDIGGRGWEIKRFKGLGEMNKEELWETTMNPANRMLRKVVISELSQDADQVEIDAREADTIFSILMGENVDRRKQFIEANAVNVRNLDV